MKSRVVDTYTIDVSITIDSQKVPQFTYYEPGNPTPLSKKECVIDVTGPTVIFYKLINLDLAPRGLKFIGAGFTKPFENIIENAYVSDDGSTLVLEDLCQDAGKTGFHLLLKCDENSLVIMSPDPQVINIPD